MESGREPSHGGSLPETQICHEARMLHSSMPLGYGGDGLRGESLCVQTVSSKPSASKALEDYCQDLCQQARNDSIDVVRPDALALHSIPGPCMVPRLP